MFINTMGAYVPGMDFRQWAGRYDQMTMLSLTDAGKVCRTSLVSFIGLLTLGKGAHHVVAS